MTPIDLTIEATTVNQRIYSRLCELLAEGRWAPGERLDERSLAEQLGVSRTPLREAIGRLASEGIVEDRPYQGKFIRTFTTDQIHDLYEVRKGLESLAVRAACRRASDEELGELRTTVESCHAALSKSDLTAFEDADRQFHGLIISFARNDALTFSLRLLSLHIQLVRRMANQEASLREETRVHRNGVVEALKERDADRAAWYLEEHIADVQQAALRQIIENESISSSNLS